MTKHNAKAMPAPLLLAVAAGPPVEVLVEQVLDATVDGTVRAFLRGLVPAVRRRLLDLLAICAAIVAGSTYSAAAMAAGVRPSALRLLKRTDRAVALRLRRAWQEQARRLREVALDASRQTARVTTAGTAGCG